MTEAGRGADFLQLSPASAPARGLTSWLAGAVRAAIIDGRLATGMALPATRALAGDLGVSRGVVVEAYQRLADEGLVSARPGTGTRSRCWHHGPFGQDRTGSGRRAGTGCRSPGGPERSWTCPPAYWGLVPVPVPVDEHGLQTSHLGQAGAAAALLTPAHQFPAGVVLGPQRRRELLDWAVAAGGTIIEDDYDAEYRYDRAPVPALQAAAPGHMAYAGTTSKTLAPGCGSAGWSRRPSCTRTWWRPSTPATWAVPRCRSWCWPG